MNYFSLLLLAALLAGCSQGQDKAIPKSWGLGEVRAAYFDGDPALAARIIDQDPARWNSYDYYPLNLVLLVESGLKTGDKSYFERAGVAADRMYAENPLEDVLAYKESITRLRDHGLELAYGREKSSDCYAAVRRLGDLVSDATWSGQSIQIEAGRWYATAVASRCDSPVAQAILVSTLAHFDGVAATERIAATLGPGGPYSSSERADFLAALCRLRSNYPPGSYSDSGLGKLEKAAAFKCAN